MLHARQHRAQRQLDVRIERQHTERVHLFPQHRLQRPDGLRIRRFPAEIRLRETREIIVPGRGVEQIGRQRRVKHEPVRRQALGEQRAHEVFDVVARFMHAVRKQQTQKCIVIIAELRPRERIARLAVAERERVEPFWREHRDIRCRRDRLLERVQRGAVRHRQPAYRNFWGERFGFSEYPPPKGCPRVWVHAVSVGETNAAKPLIAECLKRWPEADFLLTHMTPTGRDAGKRIVALAPDRISQCYLPYDIPGAMESFFRETKPSIGIVMETEIWPTMMAEARKWGVPMVLANARESQKSLDQALRVPRLMIPAVKQFAVILAQSRPDAVRFKELGAERIQVVGSIKFDIQPDAGQQKKAREWKAAIGRPVVLFASSREGEDN